MFHTANGECSTSCRQKVRFATFSCYFLRIIRQRIKVLCPVFSRKVFFRGDYNIGYANTFQYKHDVNNISNTDHWQKIVKTLIFTTRAPLRSGGLHLSRDNLRWNSCVQQIHKELSLYKYPSVRTQNTQWCERVGLTTTFSKIAVHTKQHRIHIPMQTRTQ